MDTELYDKLALLFEYPKEGFLEKISDVQERISKAHKEAGEEVGTFLGSISDLDLFHLQELYTRTFDVQSITTLDIGYVLFGEDYKRGELLVHLNQEHTKVNNDCGTELSDHLPNLLRLLPRLRDHELRNELVREILAPAIMAMIKEFEPKSLEKKNSFYKTKFKTLIDSEESRARVYGTCLKAVFNILDQDFKVSEQNIQFLQNDFIKSVGKEMAAEKA